MQSIWIKIKKIIIINCMSISIITNKHNLNSDSDKSYLTRKKYILNYHMVKAIKPIDY